MKSTGKSTEGRRYLPCQEYYCCPLLYDWCCQLWICWRCCCCLPLQVHSFLRPSHQSPSLWASCLSNMRCTDDRSCRIAHVPEKQETLIFVLCHRVWMCIGEGLKVKQEKVIFFFLFDIFCLEFYEQKILLNIFETHHCSVVWE